MSESGLDFSTKTEIFRHNSPTLIARNRHLASLMGIRLAYDAAGYAMGVTLARNSTSGLYQKYDDNAASGLNTAVGILYCDVPADAASGTDVAQMLVKGEVYESKVTGLDANGKTDLKSRSIVDGFGNTILIF
jgi:hypothetical protein